jgi:Sigma-70 factor, region 1.1
MIYQRLAKVFLICSKADFRGWRLLPSSRDLLHKRTGLNDRENMIRRTIEIGFRTGFVTFDQLNELIADKLGPENIEALLEALNAEGIQVIDE